MPSDKKKDKDVTDFQARFLAKETGITEAQARDLIKLIGSDKNSLLREARLLAKNNPKPKS